MFANFDPTNGRVQLARYRVLVFLAVFSVLRYMLAQNISVAEKYMVPELGLSKGRLGWALNAWTFGYALFQLPSGAWGDRLGPRLVLGVCVISWSVTTLMTGLVPGSLVRGFTASFLSLLILRFLLGAAMAATYPVSARMVRNWFPATERTRAMAVVLVGAPLGVAVTMPLIAIVMQFLGWRATFYFTALLPAPFVFWWWRRVKNRPGEDSAPGRADVEVISLTSARAAGRGAKERTSPPVQPRSGGHDLREFLRSLYSSLRDRNMAFLCCSYFFNSTVLSMVLNWVFPYIDEVWKMRVVTTGWAAGLPFAVAIAAMPAMGIFTDRLCARVGSLRGRRRVAMACSVVSGVSLMTIANAWNVSGAVAALCFGVGAQFCTEGSYWSMAIDLSRDKVGTAGGLLNLAGSVGFVAGNFVVPAVQTSWGWGWVFASGSAFAIAACVFWLPIHTGRQRDGRRSEETEPAPLPWNR